MTEKQFGFGDLYSFTPSALYAYKAKGYIYARKHGMTATIKTVVEFYEAVQQTYDTFETAYTKMYTLACDAYDYYFSTTTTEEA
jgi:hypothetical protein